MTTTFSGLSPSARLEAGQYLRITLGKPTGSVETIRGQIMLPTPLSEADWYQGVSDVWTALPSLGINSLVGNPARRGVSAVVLDVRVLNSGAGRMASALATAIEGLGASGWLNIRRVDVRNVALVAPAAVKTAVAPAMRANVETQAETAVQTEEREKEAAGGFFGALAKDLDIALDTVKYIAIAAAVLGVAYVVSQVPHRST